MPQPVQTRTDKPTLPDLCSTPMIKKRTEHATTRVRATMFCYYISLLEDARRNRPFGETNIPEPGENEPLVRC